MSAPSYRYLLCDLLTDQPLVDLPLTGVTFERRISRVGSLQAALQMPSLATAALGRALHDNVGRSALWVYRDNALWWGGIPWSAEVTQDQRGPASLALQAATFDSYAHRRQLRADLTYAQVDQGVIIPALWRHMQSDPRGDIGVLAADQPTGVLRDRSYYAHEQAYYGERIEQIGDVEDGPEHTVDVYLDAAGQRVKELRLAQRLGNHLPTVVFQRALRGGGRVLKWGDTRDAVDAGTTFQARGDAPNGNVGEDVAPLLSDVIERHDLLDAGWPLLDKTQDRRGVTDLETLNAWARTDAAQFGGAETVRSYAVQVGQTGWSPNRIGDAVRVKLSDVWHAEATDLTVRPVGFKVTAAEAGKAEAVELLLGGD